jgi:hypothetical protein
LTEVPAEHSFSMAPSLIVGLAGRQFPFSARSFQPARARTSARVVGNCPKDRRTRCSFILCNPVNQTGGNGEETVLYRCWGRRRWPPSRPREWRSRGRSARTPNVPSMWEQAIPTTPRTSNAPRITIPSIRATSDLSALTKREGRSSYRGGACKARPLLAVYFPRPGCLRPCSTSAHSLEAGARWAAPECLLAERDGGRRDPYQG